MLLTVQLREQYKSRVNKTCKTGADKRNGKNRQSKPGVEGIKRRDISPYAGDLQCLGFAAEEMQFCFAFFSERSAWTRSLFVCFYYYYFRTCSREKRPREWQPGFSTRLGDKPVQDVYSLLIRYPDRTPADTEELVRGCKNIPHLSFHHLADVTTARAALLFVFNYCVRLSLRCSPET